VGIKAAVHGVDPEAVEEGGHCNVGLFFSVFIVFISYCNNLTVSLLIKAFVKSSRYPLTCPNRGVRCALLFGFIKCTHSSEWP
jgi:hypothetical protein